MELTRAAIIDCRSNAPDDETFIQELNQLIGLKGDGVCTCILQTLTGLDLPPETALAYWRQVLRHRRSLSDSLDRDVDLITALNDFFRSSTKYLHRSRLVDVNIYERIIKETIHDHLTGLFNRPYFNETYEQQVSLAMRYNTDLSVLFIDIDDFKAVNDQFGHLAGDYVLQQVAHIIKREKRDSDIAARYGGEEFVLLMPHTGNVNAFILAERIRREIARATFRYDEHTISVSISGGLSSYPLNATHPEKLLTMADSALYLAKGAGKNTISLFKQEKRRYARVPYCQPVLVKELGFNKNQIYSGMSKDICIGGLLFENNISLPIDSLIMVNVPIPDRTPLLLIGTVVRVKKRGLNCFDIGMTTSFNEMERTANQEIAHFLRSN